jgi:hypothetical protein
MRRTWIREHRTRLVALAAVLGLVAAGAIVAATTGTSSREASTVSLDAPAMGEDGKARAIAPGQAARAQSPGSAPITAPDLAPLPPGGSGTVGPTGPKIVRNADLAVKVTKGQFRSAFDRVASIAAASGGYVTSSSTYAARDDRRPSSGQLTVRVPAERFDDTRRALGQLGTVEQESLRGEDVSGQLVDQEARLRSLQAQEESLRTLLAKATNVGEVLQVQNALFEVRQQIEQLQAQRAQLDQAATLATIQVSVYEPGASPIGEPGPEPVTGLAHSLDRAWDGAVAVVGGMIVVLGWLAPVAVLGGLVWGGLRLRRRGPSRRAPAPAEA